MGREIRRVPRDWEHPKFTEGARRGQYMPLHDQDYETAAEEWMKNLGLWRQGRHEAQPSCDFCRYYWEYESPPDKETCREKKWTEAEATHYQMYETVSEGTPVSPVFASPQELADYLVSKGDFWDQKRGKGGWSRAAAESFVKAGSAPSVMTTVTAAGVDVREPRDGMEY